MKGTVNSGGTYYSKAQGQEWQFINYSLGTDFSGLRNRQFFAEHETGKIFMVQLLDENVYSTDSSILSSIKPIPGASQPEFVLYPNPVVTGTPVSVDLFKFENATIRVHDNLGRLISSQLCEGYTLDFYAPALPGLYIVKMINDKGQEYSTQMAVLGQR